MDQRSVAVIKLADEPMRCGNLVVAEQAKLPQDGSSCGTWALMGRAGQKKIVVNTTPQIARGEFGRLGFRGKKHVLLTVCAVRSCKLTFSADR